ncbi:NLR family CARD domain-containing protein 3-like isoform X1 [Xyrauchen texanus]|uniref:NLR family CARD domain-containing protein 3-like isoform X1 n=1 Tax=Xyrauchen texanus TaxID=154827 RepID=UPI002241E87F|nr:NLR family CARD domain-containing protein 3-like isoform X1 [Xyrauchen texanus]
MEGNKSSSATKRSPFKQMEQQNTAASPEPSCDSDRSTIQSPDLSNGTLTSVPRMQSQRAVSSEPSCLSVKSNRSMDPPDKFSDKAVIFDPRMQTQGAVSSEPSCMSVKSSNFMYSPDSFSIQRVIFGTSGMSDDLIQVQSRCGVCEQVLKDTVSITCGHSFCRQCISCYWAQTNPSEDFKCPQCRKRSRTHPVLHSNKVKRVSNSADSAHFHKEPKLHQDSHQPVDDVHQRDKQKSIMRNKYESLFEGIKLQENQMLLNNIYTQLYIIEGESEGVNEEHEVLHMEKTARTQHLQDTPIYCNDIFKPLPEPGCKQKRTDQIKTVLTKGIAGIGKTVSVQKFILDWAEGKANQDVDLMFVLPFRELNLIKDEQYSLHKLLLDFHPELHDLDSKSYEECKVVFIFDGLDESRIPLMFTDSEKVSDVTETSSVGVLMSNLIKGDLLPSAFIWITSRPAGANQIPSKYIRRVTEIQGFNDPQKEEYFRKRISDEHQASRIISHIRRARSLHIMCHIPVFCWISSTVLQNILKQDDSAEIPQTLTEMYIHFLLIQINMRNQKYEERDPEKLLESNREVIVKLAELAYKQFMKGNVIFYEEDLRESGIDVTEPSVYSGFCTEIFKEESVILQRKVYCFIHLSFQEFLAALYLFYHYVVKNVDLVQFYDVVHTLHRYAVDKALQSENGRLDLFLRFLLGISMESNQRLLQDLLTHTQNSSESIKETITYIKDKIKDGHGLSAERSINLFLCLLEMKDQTLYREIQEFVKSDKHSENKLSPAQCSSIAYMLQMSEEVLDELDLKKYNTSEEGRRRLIPAVSNCRKAFLAEFNLTGQHCEIVVSVLQSSNSLLRELDLSNNDLQDSGVKLISDALKSPNCKLEILRLSGCMVTEKGCFYLASALSSNPSHLKELDLSYNHPGESGVKLLTERLNDPNCTLEKLSLDHGEPFRITPGLRKYFCNLTMDPNTANYHLILSEGNRKATHKKEDEPYPDHPDRFEHYEQVLCRESLTGRCYWEAEWSGWADIAVSYKGIRRKGRSDDCDFGLNENSWCLTCIDGRFTSWFNKNSIDIPVPKPQSNRKGVYLDWLAGTLSFYSISDTHTLTHLHTFHSKFTEPLYAGFGIFYSNCSVSLLD